MQLIEPRVWVLRRGDPDDEIYDGPYLRPDERVEVLEAAPILDLLHRFVDDPRPTQARAEAVMLLRRHGRG
jgi:hypothetical protein